MSIALTISPAPEEVSVPAQSSDTGGMATTAAGSFRVMPGSFLDEDAEDMFSRSFETLEELQNEWARKEEVRPVSTEPAQVEELELGDVDWHKFSPPEALFKAPGITAEILLGIISSSVENVKQRIAELDRMQEEEEDRRKKAEKEAAEKDKSEEPYLPIIIPPSRPPTPPSPKTDVASGKQPEHIVPAPAPASPPSTNDERASKSRFALRRLFQRHSEGSGESSTAGGAREALRQKLEARLSKINISTTDLKTQETIKALRESGFVTSPEAPPPEPEVECVSCLDDVPVRDTVKVPCHSYCKDCFVRLVSAAVQNENQWPPKCCLNQIPFPLVLKHIPEDLKKTFQTRASEWELPVSERVYCHQPECAVWVKPKRINMSKRQARCERGHMTCTICRGAAHGSSECPQDMEMNMTNILAEEEGWKRCANCHALVEHAEACQHMTCRCGYQFCYVCNRRWRTCQCSMEQLRAVKATASTRRAQRNARAEEEAAELRSILAQIEEFEREIARLEELERLEQVRLAEEEWKREIKRRIRAEKQRRRDVAAKFQELRTSLHDLHYVQRVLVDEDQEAAARDLATEVETTKADMIEKHRQERHDLAAQHAEKATAKEDSFNQEYATRAAQERKVEQEYLQQLQAFWADKPDAEEQIDQGMFPLRRRMDTGHRTWKAWKEEQMARYRAKLDDERTLREELMYSMRERAKDSFENRETELAKRIVAEKKWVHEVVLERGALLDGHEVQELEGDADSLYEREGEDAEDSA